jgi:hypothetical protein
MSVDMSTNTELSITFIKPGGTTVTKTKTAGEVALGLVNLTFDDPDGSPITALANEYLVYDIEPAFLDVAGSREDDNPWKAYGTYTDTGTTPDKVIIGLCVEFDVSAICP